MAKSSFINDPDHWMQHAIEMRAIADDMKEQQLKEMMLRIADEYEKLARRAVRRSNGSSE